MQLSDKFKLALFYILNARKKIINNDNDNKREKLDAIFLLYNLFCDGIYGDIKKLDVKYSSYGDFIYDNIFTYNTINDMALTKRIKYIINEVDDYPDLIKLVINNYCDSILTKIDMGANFSPNTNTNAIDVYLCKLLMQITFGTKTEKKQDLNNIFIKYNLTNILLCDDADINFIKLFYQIKAIGNNNIRVNIINHLKKLYKAYII